MSKTLFAYILTVDELHAPASASAYLTNNSLRDGATTQIAMEHVSRYMHESYDAADKQVIPSLTIACVLVDGK